MAVNKKYMPDEIEGKWQRRWDERGIYKTPELPRNKKYILDMYPYPSGASMHVGHLEGYVGTDIVSRYFRMKGYSVLHPMGWVSFGLPAENYAIKTGVHPEDSTRENIKTFKRQLNSVGLSYDWDREVNSSDPNYYKWNQWLFILLFKRGLAYKAEADVNWCTSCETVLANEQVVEGKCERCEAQVIQKKLDQWFLKITEYADRLIAGLDSLDWLNEVKVQQKNWIGKKGGINISYDVVGCDKKIDVFTTAPVNFGMTFLVVSPEYNLVQKILEGDVQVPKNRLLEVKGYVEDYFIKRRSVKAIDDKTKTGVFTGLYATNPVNNQEVPVWVSDFVLMEVGTGAVQGCPGHDYNDFEFAIKYKLPIVRVIVGPDGDLSPIKRREQVIERGMEGRFVNSEFLNGLGFEEGLQKTMDYFEEKGWGKRVTSYHIRDWLISRQRYWGTPIPMVYCEACAKEGRSWFTTEEGQTLHDRDKNVQGGMAGWYPVDEADLPVLLPKDIDFRPTGQSPITRSESFQEGVVCPHCGGKARREVDTMDGYVDSSWYFIRFADSQNDEEFASQKAIGDWLPVDIYVGGGHVVQHLLFARFFWKVLFDLGLVDKSLGDEPFLKLRAPGWILGPDSRKMSKRWGNVVTPDDIVPKYGADTLRMYEMFMGPFEAMKPWSMTGVEGMSRFLNRIWRLFEETGDEDKQVESDKRVLVLINKLVEKVGKDIEDFSFNTAISGMMEAYNELVELRRSGAKVNWVEVWRNFLLVMAPFAPHMTEELWQTLEGEKKSKVKGLESNVFSSIHQEKWPEFDPSLVQDETVEIPVQVNGRLRGTVTLDSDTAKNEEKVTEEAKKQEGVAKYIEGQQIKKVIFVPGRLINFVV